MGSDWGWPVLVGMLMAWGVVLVRRRIGGTASTVSRKSAVSHPYHCVMIKPRGGACDLARSIAGERFLAADAPPLPLSGCTKDNCRCVYRHFDDRRRADRRSLAIQGAPSIHHGPDMRGESRGRRRKDLLHARPARRPRSILGA